MSSFAIGISPQALIRLNSVLSSKLELRVESSKTVVDAINKKRKLGTKRAVLFKQLSGCKLHHVRPIARGRLQHFASGIRRCSLSGSSARKSNFRIGNAGQRWQP